MTKVPLYSAAVPHDRVVKDCGEVSLTRQEFADECDVNRLMARYEKTGVWPMMAPDTVPRYLDLTGVPDFHQAMQLVVEAEAAFMALPAVVRREFENDPALFVDFAQVPENLAKMREWGLAAPEKAQDAPAEASPSDAPGPAPGATASAPGA